MGAESFLHVLKTKEDPQVLYTKLVKEAYYYHGHDPYNGTISTTTGLKEHFQHFHTDEEVQAFLDADDLFNYVRKWEVAKFVRFPETDRIAIFGWAAC